MGGQLRPRPPDTDASVRLEPRRRIPAAAAFSAAYIAQDAFFLDAFARAYALALARSRDTTTLLTLADLIGGVRAELGLHAAYSAGGAPTRPSLSPRRRPSPTRSFCATAATGAEGLTYAAMTPCMRLYAFLGSSLDPSTAGRYADWIMTYADPDFQALAARLEQLLDDHAPDSVAAGAIYRRAMTLELAFFDAS